MVGGKVLPAREVAEEKSEDCSRGIGSTREVPPEDGVHAVHTETRSLANKGQTGGDVCYRLPQMEESESDKFLDHISQHLKPKLPKSETKITVSRLVTHGSTCLL